MGHFINSSILVLILSMLVALSGAARIAPNFPVKSSEMTASAAACDLCFLAVNEVQGLLAENASEVLINFFFYTV